jgi:hypothetical protein
MTEQLKPGDYIGLYIEDVLIYVEQLISEKELYNIVS